MDKDNSLVLVTPDDIAFLEGELGKTRRPFSLHEMTETLAFRKTAGQRSEVVKIYDPNNLGVSCGFSTNPPLPGWIMCRVPPEDLQPGHKIPEGRRRWWRALFST